MSRSTAFLLLFALAVLAILSGNAAFAAEEKEPFTGLYILSFNRWGELANPAERDLAISQLSGNPDLERIIIFSYGWANDGESSYATYFNTIREIQSKARERARPGTAAVIAIGWDSSQSGFRKLFNNMIPLPAIANALAWLPDQLLFPISFWSKAAQADRIGFGGLRTTLNEIFAALHEGSAKRPEIFLVGHSFGTRILSALMQDRLGIIPVREDPFIAANDVKGAILLQPALVLPNLHRGAHYPVVVTMSRHDRANGALFPLANLVINSFAFTAFEALFRRQVIEVVEATVGGTVGSVSDIVLAPLPSADRDDAAAEEEEARRWSLGRPANLARRSLAELASIPASVLFTLAVAPLTYVSVQVKGLLRNPPQHVLDTLASLPVAEIGVAALDRLLSREVPSGQRSKGFLTLGSPNEAVGRLLTPELSRRSPPEVWSYEQLMSFDHETRPCGLPVCEGILVVDASEVVKIGLLGDLSKPALDFTLGWIDPIGAHGDYTNEAIVSLIGLVINGHLAAP